MSVSDSSALPDCSSSIGAPSGGFPDWGSLVINDVFRKHLPTFLNFKEIYAARLTCRSWQRSVAYPALGLSLFVGGETHPNARQILLEARELSLDEISESTATFVADTVGLFSLASCLRKLDLYHVPGESLALIGRALRQGGALLNSLVLYHSPHLSGLATFFDDLQACTKLERLKLFGGVPPALPGRPLPLPELLFALPKLRVLTIRDAGSAPDAVWLAIARAAASRTMLQKFSLQYKYPRDSRNESISAGDAMADILKHCSSLTSFSLELFNIRNRPETAPYTEFWRNMTTLKTLRFPRSCLPVARAITSAHRFLTSIELDRVDGDAIPHLGPVLLRLRSLRFNVVPLSALGVALLADCITNSTCLTSLFLGEIEEENQMDVTELAGALLCSFERATTTLRSLEIQFYPLSVDSMNSLGALLRRSGGGLQSFRLLYCRLTSELSNVLAESIKASSCVTSLEVQPDTELPLSKSFVQALVPHQTLEVLVLLVNTASFEEIGSLLKYNTRLRQLRLVQAKFDDGQLAHVLDAAADNSTLQLLEIRAVSMGVRAVSALSALIEKNRALRTLDISHPPTASESHRQILQSLQLNQTLTYVRLPREDASDPAVSAEFRALEKSISSFKEILIN